MSFGLINASPTFQRAMDIAFQGLTNECMVVYLDDVTVYSKRRTGHVKHLRQIFEQCRKYSISLNPKKSIFGVTEGKLLGFIVSKEGIKIDHERMEAISKISPPPSKKSMQSFLGNINFVRRFVLDFAEIFKPLQDIIKEDQIYKWKREQGYAFSKIKEAIARAPTLKSPDFTKDFILYTCSSDTAFVAVLTQKTEDKQDTPIAFMNLGLQGAELRYPDFNKLAYAVYKIVKHFKPYLLKSHTKVIMSHPSVMSILVQKEVRDKRGNWITALYEYDLEIKLAKLVKT